MLLTFVTTRSSEKRLPSTALTDVRRALAWPIVHAKPRFKITNPLQKSTPLKLIVAPLAVTADADSAELFSWHLTHHYVHMCWLRNSGTP